jgi:hypothetical protein
MLSFMRSIALGLGLLTFLVIEGCGARASKDGEVVDPLPEDAQSDGIVVTDVPPPADTGTLKPDGGGGGLRVGPGTSTPFDPKAGGSSGVKLNPSGEIVLDPTDFTGGSSPLIWVANSSEGTISKIDTRTMKELARYRTGPDSFPDPSRTTVSLNGDVVVVNRAGASATKIASKSTDCIGKGAGTSKSGSDVRAWGDDKCVLWNTPFPAGSLGRAGAFDAEKGIDGSLSTGVWVGLYNLSKMEKLDSKTGKILAEIDVSPVRPYGAAADASHNIWVWGGGVGKIDGLTKKWTTIAPPPCAYGVAVDPKGRVWTSGGGCVARYTPSTSTWESLTIGSSNRGLAVDAKGSVWVADTSFGVHEISMDKLTSLKDVPMPGGSWVGMAIDFDGMVWAVNQGLSKATKIDPKTLAPKDISVGSGPYTYSDMTGFQLRNAGSPFGKYYQTFMGCGPNAIWKTVDWTAITGTGTSIVVRARVADTADLLKTATFIEVAKQPSDTPPIDLVAKMGDAGKGQWIELEFALSSTSSSTTPILSSISVNAVCPPK